MDLLSADKYSLCRAERANWSAMNFTKRENKKDEIWDWIYTKLNYTPYFMLLCREKNDYTVFNCSISFEKELSNDDTATNIINELEAVLDSRGNWIAADFDEQSNVWQLWINRGGEANAYIFFDAQGFVIEC